ncbi:MAG: CDP-alcohol phosphatidyltransferase family protein [Clostridia bacterium]|nr:CDP-alcohol phosphatidyltransferase family protein [Clostridia bacterium]
MKFIGVYDYTVILTYMSLISGLIGIRLAYSGQIMWAMLCLLTSGICDMFDGVVARTKKNRTEDEKNFGIQLDSLCDVVCFGVVPAVILYFSGVDEIWGIAFLVFYVLCAVIRLAFFNVLETKRQQTEGGCTKYYRGLPVTNAGFILPACFLLDLIVPDNVMNVIYHVLPVVVGLMFITDVRVPKLDLGKLFSKPAKKKSKQKEQ